ncbi:MAG: hypothetical protein PHV02_13640 [Rhodocyclaceae bacterium]|nr:hypothetical protein [Rhodocyclaceae bacterium]
MRFPRSLFLIIALNFATPASAAPLNVLGLDDMSCAAWAKSKDDPDQRQLYLAWARGALSGHNYAMQSQQVSVVSIGTVELNINRYCSKNPKGLLSDAVFRMSDQFSGRNEPIRK